MRARDHTNGYATGVDQIDRQSAERFRQWPGVGSGCPCQAQDIGLVLRLVGGTEESRAGTAANDHAWSVRVGAAQM